jgi:hypothetical protein
MSQRPPEPQIVCDTNVKDIVNGYYTDRQSNLNAARKDKFRLIISIPKTLRKYYIQEDVECFGGNMDRLQYRIWGNVLPEISVPAIDITRAGQTMKFTSYTRPAYPPIQVNFTIDNNFSNYYVIWQWLALLNDPATSIYDSIKSGNNIGRLEEYSVDFTLQVLDEYDTAVTEFIYTNAYPTNLGAVNFNYKEIDELHSTFTFAFSKLLMKRIR